jgi:sialic acid synthase SpsE
MSNLADVSKAIEAIRGEGNEDILIFQTTSIYPNDPKDANLHVMETFRRSFGLPVGFSDHTADIYTPIAAAALGANMIEKHFCLSRSDPGTDTFFALEPTEFKEMCKGIKIAEAALGTSQKHILKGEKETAKGFRKSFIAWKDIKKGEVLTEDNTIIKRPGKGIWPQHYEAVLGAKVNRDIKKEDFIYWEDITERT